MACTKLFSAGKKNFVTALLINKIQKTRGILPVNKVKKARQSGLLWSNHNFLPPFFCQTGRDDSHDQKYKYGRKRIHQLRQGRIWRLAAESVQQKKAKAMLPTVVPIWEASAAKNRRTKLRFLNISIKTLLTLKAPLYHIINRLFLKQIRKHYRLIVTLVPFGTIEASSITSLLCMRMQPLETALPIEAGLFVPCIP